MKRAVCLLLLVSAFLLVAWLVMPAWQGSAPVAVTLSTSSGVHSTAPAATVLSATQLDPAEAEIAPAEPPSPQDREPASGAHVVAGGVYNTAADQYTSGVSVRLLLGDTEHEQVSGPEGKFSFELDEPPPQTLRFELHVGGAFVIGHRVRWEPEIELWFFRATVVNVTLPGTSLLPKEAWLSWEADEEAIPADARFGNDEVAAIQPDIRNRRFGPCRACALWYGQLLVSEPFEIEWGASQEVVLALPAAASISVRVIGPDGLPFGGVPVEVGYARTRLTSDSGEAVFGGVPLGHELSVRLADTAGIRFCGQTRTVKAETPGELIEVLFDLAGCGIVVPVVTAATVSFNSIEVAQAGREIGRIVTANDEECRVHGLRPGRYQVRAMHQGWSHHAAEFDVVAWPQLSIWRAELDGEPVTMRANGAGDQPVRAFVWCDGYGRATEHKPDADGAFRIISGGLPFVVQLSCATGATGLVQVDPAETRELELDLQPCGTLQMKERGGGSNIHSVVVQALDEEAPALAFAVSRLRSSGGTIRLLPGRYRISDPDEKFWDAIEVVVRANEVTESLIGPESWGFLHIHANVDLCLDGFDVSLRKDGQDVTWSLHSIWENSGRYNRLTFPAAGELSLSISRAGYKTIEVRFQVSPGRTTKLEIVLQRSP
jgi:hypothetical protein